ncbi:ABC transporter permease [Natronobiforma cellulositropha]|uniref:ABC transporter permease n=1 Tax=Natronobiforma cellulositropha TaxID=1679076 RepID=UPI0021D5E6EA|nr:ABC transporter permease [Natronobiforma cellulositropha]
MSGVEFSSVRAIAIKDFRDAVRSWTFWGLSALFFLVIALVVGVLAYFGQDIAAEGATTEVLVMYLSGITRPAIPLIALLLGWKAIAGERESGSIKIMLSLPHSRTDAILGKVIGRSAVLSLSLIIGFALAAVIVAVVLGGFDVAEYGGLLLVSIIYAVAYTSIAVAVSSTVRSTTAAAAILFSIFLLFYLLWDLALIAGFTLISLGYLPDSEYTYQLLLFLYYLDPGMSYTNILSLVTSAVDIDIAVLAFEGQLERTPFFLRDWFSLVILLCWVVVPTAIGIARFNRTDL